MPKKSRLNLRADSVAEVTPACVAAFNNFIDNVEELERVKLHMHADYEAASNTPRDNQDGTGGPRLVLSFGDRASSDMVTNWTFLFPNLSGKGKNASSLHYKKDGAEDVSGGTREPVECVSSDPRQRKTGVNRLREPARDFMRRSSRMVNSMSFGGLFGDPVDGLSDLISLKDVDDIRKRPKVAETASYRKAVMTLVRGAGTAMVDPDAAGLSELESYRRAVWALVSGAGLASMQSGAPDLLDIASSYGTDGVARRSGQFAGISDNKAVQLLAGVYKNMEGVLDGKAYGDLDPDNPLDRLMTWYVLDNRYDIVRALRENGPAKGGLQADMANRVATIMFAADAGGYAPDSVSLASKAMGLDALYKVLDKADDDIWNNKGSADSLDFGKYLDDVALQGLLYLSAYKEVQDHGGAYGKSPKGNGRADSVAVMAGGDTANVYHKLCKTRAKQELRSRSQAKIAVPPGRAFPKTVLGDVMEAETRSVTEAMSYRLFREIALGESPELVSGAPLGKLYIGPAENGSLGPVMCDIESGGKGMRLADVLAGRKGNLLSGLPVLEAMGQDGESAAVIKRARDIISKEDGRAADILSLELAMFSAQRKGGTYMSQYDGRLRASEANLIERQRGGPAVAGVPAKYFYAIDHSYGYPSMRYGTMDMGDGIVAEALSRISGDAPSASILPYATAESHSKPGKSALSFRIMDYGRQACVDAYGPVPKDGWYGLLSGNSTFHAMQTGLLDKAHAMDGDGWTANDALVLSDCYGIWSEQEMKALEQDVLSPGGTGLYRPTCKAEADILRTCYGYAHGRTVNLPVVPSELQGTTEGFAAALAPALEAEPGLRPKVMETLRSASYNEGTLARDPYGDVLQILEPRQKEVQEVQAAVDAAHLNAVLESGAMAKVRSINAASDLEASDVPAGGPKGPGEN